jgi:transposase-like protein
MQEQLSEMLESSVGIRALNERLHEAKQAFKGKLTSLPPVMLLDALWVTLMQPTGELRRDRRGRLRPVKVAKKIPVLVALGVWPKSGQWQVLDWLVAESEAQEAWEPLLLRLEDRGVFRERGLELILHDGGSGLTAALRLIYPTVPHQRCIFHKLRNVWQAVLPPDPLPAAARRRFRASLISQAAAGFQADSEAAARSLVQQFRLRWADSQPQAVLALERDLDDTLRFFQLRRRFPDWRPSALRSTSLLERLNRSLRRLFRPATLFHSQRGLLAATARVLDPFLAS